MASEGERVFTNCTTGGPVRIHVKNDKITSVEPLEYTPDDAGKWVIKARDKSFSPPDVAKLAPYIMTERARIYCKERQLYPLLRVDFDPKGERNPQNRGKSGYKRISWDEALDILTSEIIRIHKTYGPGAILSTPSSHHNWGNIGYRHSSYFRFMGILGATYADHNPDSWEGWHWGAMHTWGYAWRLGVPEQYDLLEDGLKNAEMIVFWGSDPDGQPMIYTGQESTIWRFWLKEVGVKMVFVDPHQNFTAAHHADKWLAPRPGTDTALCCGIAHTWLSEGTYDKEYVASRTYGFDKWVDYIMGKEDGVAKTAEWAEKETTIPAHTIKALAREWAAKRTMLACGGLGGGPCRTAYAHEWARMMIYLQAMQGLGKPGRGMWTTNQGAPFNAGFFFPGYAEGGICGDGNNSAAGYELVARGITKHPIASMVNNPIGQHVPRLRIPEALEGKEFEWHGKGFCGSSNEMQFKKFSYPAEGFSKCRMYWRYGGAFIGTMCNTNRYVRAYTSPLLEFAVSQSIYMEGEAKFADLILPACTNFERNDIGEWANCSGYIPHSSSGTNRRTIVLMEKAIEPLGESKSDYEIFRMVAARLGFEGKFTEGGKTEMDWVKRMFECTDLPKYTTWEDFSKKGYFVVPIPEDYKSTPALRWFAEDRKRDTPDWGCCGGGIEGPNENKGNLATQSGLIEFESQSLLRFDPNDE
jgi:trimethylamine-N-oxide reductase (cytochrome c)